MLSTILLGFVGILHLYFFLLESYLYTTALGKKVFNLDEIRLNHTKLWAFNQGYYNLAVGLGLLAATVLHDRILSIYLLLFVILVGVVGGLSFSKKIFWLQAFPALIALTVVLL